LPESKALFEEFIMKAIKTIITTIAMSLPLIAVAEGSYQADKKIQEQPTTLKTSEAKKMNHTAAQHKQMMTKSSAPKDSNQLNNTHSHVKKHDDHMAVDHKRHDLGEQ
jgi:hypothetical protein